MSALTRGRLMAGGCILAACTGLGSAVGTAISWFVLRSKCSSKLGSAYSECMNNLQDDYLKTGAVIGAAAVPTIVVGLVLIYGVYRGIRSALNSDVVREFIEGIDNSDYFGASSRFIGRVGPCLGSPIYEILQDRATQGNAIQDHRERLLDEQQSYSRGLEWWA